MLLPTPTLARIQAGEIDLAFRKWKRPTVKVGTLLHTALGVVAIDEVAQVSADSLTEAEVRRAGYSDPATLMRGLSNRSGSLYRIRLHFHGGDPRVELRNTAPSLEEIRAILSRLGAMDQRSPHGPWTKDVLALIAKRKGQRAAGLAALLGRETLSFKADVRKLKALGLTVSLATGYDLSPRGRAVLAALHSGQ